MGIALLAAIALDTRSRPPLAKVDGSAAANTELRKLFLANAVTAELHEMRERMEGLLGRINTAAVVP